jgi:hypothetical protein
LLQGWIPLCTSHKPTREVLQLLVIKLAIIKVPFGDLLPESLPRVLLNLHRINTLGQSILLVQIPTRRSPQVLLFNRLTILLSLPDEIQQVVDTTLRGCDPIWIN